LTGPGFLLFPPRFLHAGPPTGPEQNFLFPSGRQAHPGPFFFFFADGDFLHEFWLPSFPGDFFFFSVFLPPPKVLFAGTPFPSLAPFFSQISVKGLFDSCPPKTGLPQFAVAFLSLLPTQDSFFSFLTFPPVYPPFCFFLFFRKPPMWNLFFSRYFVLLLVFDPRCHSGPFLSCPPPFDDSIETYLESGSGFFFFFSCRGRVPDFLALGPSYLFTRPRSLLRTPHLLVTLDGGPVP